MTSLAVIVPLYNEQMNAEKCVHSICRVLTAEVPEARLFVVNDGSSDGTLQVLQTLESEQLPLVVCSHPINQGYGAAVVTGLRRARDEGFTFGLVMDSDLTNDPRLIPKFNTVLKEGNIDLIKASRFVPGGGMQGVPFGRRIVSFAGNRVAQALFQMGIADCTNGFHAVRLDMVCSHEFAEKGFAFLLEELLLLKARGARVAEIPYILTGRDSGEGESKFTYSFLTLWSYLKYALRALFTPARQRSL